MKTPVAPVSSSTPRARPRAPIALAFSLAIASLSLLAGCPGQLEGPFPPAGLTGGGSGGSTSPGCDAPGTIFKDSCTLAGCHGASFGIPPNLVKDPVFDAVKGVASQFDCAPMNLVETSKPAAGVLVERITGSACGEQMPPTTSGKSYLTSDQIQCVKDWIESNL